MCRYFGNSRAGYYKLVKAGKAAAQEENKVLECVRKERFHQPRIGGKKLYSMYGTEVKMGRDKFFDVLRENRLLIKRKRQYARTTDSKHKFKKYHNKLKDIVLTAPNQAYAGDITYIRTDKGFVYLSLLTDVYSRKIVGWEVSNSLSIEGSIIALKKALKQAGGAKGIIHHSDRGIQYCCKAYVKLTEKKHKMQMSMTEENHCYENAIAERVNGILKEEFLLDATFKDLKMARKAATEAIEVYNNRRPHWSLDLRIPAQVHKEAA